VDLPHHDVAIIGSGFAGRGMAIELGREYTTITTTLESTR
jgi:thioredoxin reductase